jgi:hypothetical protein
MTDIVDRIRQVALALGWRFTYGEQDIKNLIEAAQAQDLVPDEVHLMLLPVVRTPVTNDYGGISQINYELAFSIFAPDDFDILVEDAGKEYYWQKFDYKVKPMLTAYYYLHRNLICPGVVLQPRRITEIYNDGTENLTGIFIEATASIDVDSRLGEVVPVPPLPPIPTLCDLLVDCEAFSSLEERVTALEAITPEDLISSDSGNQLTTGTDGGLYVATGGGGGGLTCEDLEDCQVIQDIEEALDGKANTSDLAEVALSGAYADLSGTPTLATVATTGSYNDLTDTPNIPAAKLSINDLTRSASSGTVTLQILRTITIPANTMGDGIYDLIGRVGKAAGAAMSFFYYFGTTSADLTGCTLIATVQTTANNQLYLQMARRIAATGNTLYFFQASENALTDSARTTNAENTLAYDPTVPNFLHVVITTSGNIAFNHSFTSLCQR